MHVIAQANIRNEDIRLALNKSECAYGESFELPDAIAEVYLKQGLVIRATKPDQEQKDIAEKPPIEVAAHSGAPEHAVTRRGGMTKSSFAPKVKDG